MQPELETYARQLRWTLEELSKALADLSPAELNWRPATGEANSAYAIASHVLGSTRVYALGFGCGLAVERDRPSEFAASGEDAAELVAALGRLADEIGATMGTVDASVLERRFVPPRELFGTGDLHEMSGRDAIVETIRHAGTHLGELRLTRDLAKSHQN